LFVDFQHIV